MIVKPDWKTMDLVALWHEAQVGTPGAQEELDRRVAAGEIGDPDES